MNRWREAAYGTVPASWKEDTLGNICELLTDGAHFSPKEVESNYFMASVKDMRYNRFDFSACKTISADDFQTLKAGKCSPECGDILLSKDGANCLDLIFVYRQPEKIVLLSSIAIARLRKGYNPDFYRYFLLSPNVQYHMRTNFVSGSAIPRVVLKDFKNVPIPVPPIDVQDWIAEVLGSLDYKIDLLHRQNQTLEQIAESLYRQWFVEEEKETWSEVLLGEYVRTITGYSYRSDDLRASTTALVTLKNFSRDGGFKTDGFKAYAGKYKQEQTVVSGDLVVAHTDITQDAAVIGNPALVVGSHHYETLVISTDLVKVTPKSYLSTPFLYLLMKSDDFKHYCLGCSNGTTVLHLPKAAVPSYSFKLPPQSLVEKFTVVVKPVFEKIRLNHKHIVELQQTRDTLLPKLMSGEVRIHNTKTDNYVEENPKTMVT